MRTPTVSIVLPVYNGQRYIRYAVESVLGQTYRDFELCILDNASTDATEDICNSYVRQDSRIRYHRHPKNLGASLNHILGFKMALGKYVKLLAHDDAWDPTLLEKSVRVLDEHPEVVLVYPRTRWIDKNGDVIGDFQTNIDFSSTRARDRVGAVVHGRHRAYPIFGLARRSAMAKTDNLKPYVDSDRVWLAQLALQGPFYEIKEYLFLSREHDGGRYAGSTNTPTVALAWFDPTKKQKLILPYMRLYREYLKSVVRADLPMREKAASFYVVATCLRNRWWRNLFKEDVVRIMKAVTPSFVKRGEVAGPKPQPHPAAGARSTETTRKTAVGS